MLAITCSVIMGGVSCWYGRGWERAGVVKDNYLALSVAVKGTKCELTPLGT